MTNQLLSFSRTQLIAPCTLDVAAVVAETALMLQRLIGEDVELVISQDPGHFCVRADQGQLEQVLLNLAGNARDAMPEGGCLTFETTSVFLGEAFVHHHPEVAPGEYVRLEVSDTGSGMNEATRVHLFEPFFTTKKVGKGTGLGLATVYGIVRQHQGYIYVESELHRGTKFTIYLPRLHEPVFEARPTQKVEPPSAGTETILLVEDEAFLRTCDDDPPEGRLPGVGSRRRPRGAAVERPPRRADRSAAHRRRHAEDERAGSGGVSDEPAARFTGVVHFRLRAGGT